ncbi:MAG: hypothetical protein DHS20C14_17800 [Phycisphaeraceae bacterium]|nr:MAG: hypothetical protein DHS20C14_17800 [Phycisphaeraceae bacterium]
MHKRLGVVVVGLAVVVLVGACRSPAYRPSGDPLLDLRNPNLFAPERSEAAHVAWGEVRAGVRDRARTRGAFKDLAWSHQTPDALRHAVLELILSDTDPEGEADSKRLIGLMLPAEPSLATQALLASTAAERGWVELTPSLVRSWGREIAHVPDDGRVERAALARLHPNRTVEQVVFDVFLDPTGAGVGAADAASLRLPQRTRADAWGLLSRLDPEGLDRIALLRGANPTDPEARKAVDDLIACWRELGALPDTAMEIQWLARLRGATDESAAAQNSAWWAQTSSAVARLGQVQRDGLELRHAEPIRWASLHRPGWLVASRSDLLALLDETLSGRDRHARTADMNPQRPASKERLRDWDDRLAWGDVLAILVVDRAIATPGFAEALFEHVEADRGDKTTEYGGVIEAVGEGDGFRLVLFRPRARDRRDDNRFVASDDMVRYSDRALAHYHQHVQNVKYAKFAGPSDGDLDYARLSGRSSVVFTAIDTRRVNVDYYMGSGAVIDLGELRRE